MKRTWKIIENKKIKDALKLECCVEIKEGKKIIGSIESKENKKFNVTTAQGTGTYFDNFDECIKWLKMLNSDILGRNQEFIIKY
jgi:hypothetical protein